VTKVGCIKAGEPQALAPARQREAVEVQLVAEALLAAEYASGEVVTGRVRRRRWLYGFSSQHAQRFVGDAVHMLLDERMKAPPLVASLGRAAWSPLGTPSRGGRGRA
jgi:hypothetical protein